MTPTSQSNKEIVSSFLKKYSFVGECQCDLEVNSTCVLCSMYFDFEEALDAKDSKIKSLEEALRLFLDREGGDHSYIDYDAKYKCSECAKDGYYDDCPVSNANELLGK